MRTELFAGKKRTFKEVNEKRESPNPLGLCMCGCGEQTPIADGTDASKGWVKGEHIRYVFGHGNHARIGMKYEPHDPMWRWTR